MKTCLVCLFFFFVITQSANLRKKRFVQTAGSITNNEAENNEGDTDFVLTGPIKPDTSAEEEDCKNDIVQTEKCNKPKNTPELPENTGTFWHLTDLHLDFRYDLNADSKSLICPSSNGAETLDAGPYGDYRCDAPYKLINSSIYAMKEKFPDPDFIIWTGDDTFHTNDEDEYFDEATVLATIKNITDLLKQAFPTANVYPALGNHDYHPKNQMPVGESDLLNGIAELWTDPQWLGDLESVVFRDGGYYSMLNRKMLNLQMVVLNTNLWYSSNKQVNVTYDEDPAGQFAYLDSVLQRASNEGLKVYIIGHIPPGYFELVDYKYWFYPEYNTRYVNLVKKYGHVIAGQFFGHHHTDSFRIFKLNDQTVSTAFIAPGVSPWMTTLPGVKDGANNPAIRLFYYNNENSDMETYAQPTDYLQYYLDLDKANRDPEAEWKLEYRATETYGLSDLSNFQMQDLYKSLRDANLNCRNCQDNCDDCEDYGKLQNYSKFNSVSYNDDECDEPCQRRHTCAIAELEKDGYEKCIHNGGTKSQVNRLWAILVIAVLFILNRNC